MKAWAVPVTLFMWAWKKEKVWKKEKAARDCSSFRMSNVLQAVDFLKLSQSFFEKLKNRNCCKLSFRMLIFEAAEKVTLGAFLTRSYPSAWFLFMLLCLCRVRVLLLPQIWCGFQREEKTWGEITKAAWWTSCFSAPDTISEMKSVLIYYRLFSLLKP